MEQIEIARVHFSRHNRGRKKRHGAPPMPVTVRSEAWDVDHRLAQLGLTREVLLEVVRACAAAHGGCTDNDPPNAKGIEVWRWGVRRLRELLRPEGFEKDDT